MDKFCKHSPLLLIFDIDETLIKKGLWTKNTINGKFYDDTILKPFIGSPYFQVALASFNVDPLNLGYPSDRYLGGKRLGRHILNMYYGNCTESIIHDDFIQCWRYHDTYLNYTLGKKGHIHNIITAYTEKYNSDPECIYFFDDQLSNVILACNDKIKSYHVTNGLTWEKLPWELKFMA